MIWAKCYSGIEYTTVILDNKHIPICYICNKNKEHIPVQYRGIIQCAIGWVYDIYNDKYTNSNGIEISRAMLHTLLTTPHTYKGGRDLFNL